MWWVVPRTSVKFRLDWFRVSAATLVATVGNRLEVIARRALCRAIPPRITARWNGRLHHGLSSRSSARKMTEPITSRFRWLVDQPEVFPGNSWRPSIEPRRSAILSFRVAEYSLVTVYKRFHFSAIRRRVPLSDFSSFSRLSVWRLGVVFHFALNVWR